MKTAKRMIPALFAMILLGGPASFADSMWTVDEMAEIDGFSELDDVMKLKFKDAVSGEAIEGLKVEFAGKSFAGDFDGVVEFPAKLVSAMVDEDLPFVATAKGYVSLKDNLRVRVGTIISKRFLMTKDLEAGQARFVLEWDRAPLDIDARLVGPGFTVSYRRMSSSAGNARLDRDARHGFGPETITLLAIRSDATYTYSIENYSGEAPMRNVKITVYINNEVDRVLFLSEVRKLTLNILTITNGRLEYLVR